MTRNEGNVSMALGMAAWAIPMILQAVFFFVFRFTRITMETLVAVLPSVILQWLPFVLGIAALFVGWKGMRVAKTSKETPSKKLIVGLTLGVLAIINRLWGLAFHTLLGMQMESMQQRLQGNE